MKKMMAWLSTFAVVLCLVFCAVPARVNADETLPDKAELIKLIAPDGENAVLKMQQPTSIVDAEVLFTSYLNKVFQMENYSGCMVYGSGEAPFTKCTVHFQGYSDPDWSEDVELNVTYDQSGNIPSLDKLMKQLNSFAEDDLESYYKITDLSLINYLCSYKGEASMNTAIRYSSLNEVIRGADISFIMDLRAGDGMPECMYEFAFGILTVYYKDYLAKALSGGVYMEHLLYIPQDTPDTTEAYVEAAQKRINDYLGKDSAVQVSYGGSLEGMEWAEALPVSGHDGNYYAFKIGEETYNFYLVKADAEKLSQPVYVGTELNSGIEVTSESVSLPMDTTVSVESKEKPELKDKLGTTNYLTYDISLYSEMISSYITNVEDGTVTVKIPVPAAMEGKNLAVYYYAADGTEEKHEVTVKDGFAEFQTNHFSEYTLAEVVSSTGEGKVVVDTSDIHTTEALTDTIKNEIQSVSDGGSIEFAAPEGTVVSKELVQALVDKGVEVTIKTANASFSFGKLSAAVEFNPAVTIGEKVEAVDKLLASANVSTKTVDISFAHDGNLPGVAEVTLDLSTSGLTNGNKVYLYYFNEKTNKFELTSSAELKDGKATFTMKHCSDYVVSAEKLPSSIATSVVQAGDNVNMVVPVLALLLGAGLVCLVCLRRRTAK